MPYSRPSLADLVTRTKTDFEGRLGTNGPTLRRSFIAVAARVYAGLVHLLYGFLNYISLQVFPDSAEAEYLRRWASFFGITQKQATFAQGSIVVTGTAGTLVSAGTRWQTAQNAVYTTDSDFTFSSGTGSIPVTAFVYGTAGNQAPATALTIVSPLTGLNSNAVVDASGLNGGTEIETDSALLARLLLRIQNPPHGGTSADYKAWALEVSFVTRAWIYPLFLGAGTVGVAFVEDGNSTSIFPNAADVATVQADIDARRPVTAKQVTVFAPTDAPVPMQIHLVPNTAATQAAVTAQLKDMFARDAQPGGTILLSHILEAIELGSGVTDSRLDSPTANVVPAATALPRLGAITWV